MNEEQLIFAKALLEYYATNGIPKNNPRTYDALYHLHETATCSKLMLKAVKDDLYSHIRRNTAPPWIACNPEYSYIFTCLRKQITPEYTDPCQTVINFLKEVLTYYEECKRVPFTTEERAGMVRHIYPKSEILRKPMRSALSKLHRQLNNGKRSGWMFPEMLDQVNRVAAMNFEQNGHLLQISQEEEERRKAVKRKKKVETSGESDSDYSPPISFWQRGKAFEGESKASTSKNITNTDVENNLEDDNLADTDYTPEEPFVCRNLEDNEIKELRRLVAKREDLFQRQFIYYQERISRMGERLKKKIKKIADIQQHLDKADYIEVDEAYKRKQEQIDVLEAKLQEKERFNTQNQKPLLSLEAFDCRQKLAEKEQELEVVRLQLASSIPLEEIQKLSDELVQARDVLQQKEVQLKVLQDQHEASVLEAIKTAQLHEELVTLRQSLESKCLEINPVEQKINDLSIPGELSSLRSSLEAKEAEILKKDSQIAELRILVETAHNLEFEKLKKEVQRLKKEIEEDDEELRSNDSEIEDLKIALKKAEELSAEVPELKENLKKAGENLQQKEQSMRDLELDLIILKDDKTALIENLSKVERNLEEKEQIIKELQSKSQKSYQDGERIQKLSSDLTKHLEELQQKTNTIDVLMIENESLERSSQKLSQDLKKIQEESTKLAEDLSKSEKLVMILEESLQGKTDLSKRMEDSTVILTKELKEKDLTLKELKKSKEDLQKLLNERSSELKKFAKKENFSSDCLVKQLQEKEKELLVKATVIKELKRVNEQLKAVPISPQKEAKELAQLRKSFGDLQIDLEDKNKKLEKLKEQKKKDKEAIQKTNNQLFQLLNSIEEKTKEIEELSKFRKKAMKETAANLKISEENSKLKEKLEESESQSKEKERELIKLRNVSKLVEEIPILKRRLKEAKDSHLKATKELENANKILENSQKILEEKLAERMKIIEEKDKSLNKLQSDLTQVRQEAEESSKNVEKKDQNLQNVTKMMEEKDFELADLQEKALKKLEELAKLKDQLRLKEKSIESGNETQNILKNRVQEQETQLRSQIDEISNLKTSLEEKEAEANEQKRLRSNLEIEIQKIRDEILQENHQLKEILKDRDAEKAGMNRELIVHITKLKQFEMERIHLLQGRSHPLEIENYRRQIFQKDTIINEMKKGLQQMEEALSAAQVVLKESDDKHKQLIEKSARDLIQQSQIYTNEKMRLEEELRITRRLLAVKETQLQGTAGTLDGTSDGQEQFVQAAPMDSSLQMYVQYFQSNQVCAESQVPAFYIMQQDGLAQENVQYVVYPQQGTSTEQATYQVTLPDGRIGQIVENFQLDHRQPEVDQSIPVQTEPITTGVKRNPPVEEKFNIKKVVVEDPAVYQDDQQQVFVPQQETELAGTSYDYPGLSQQQDSPVYAPAVFNFPSSHSFITQAQFQQPTFTQPQAQTQTTFALPQTPFLRNRNAYPSTPTPAMINGVAHHRSPPNSNGMVPVPNYSSLRRAIQGSVQVPRSTEGAMPPPRGSRGPGRPRKHPRKALAAGK